MKKGLIKLIVPVLGLASLVGCGGGNSGGSKTVTIYFRHRNSGTSSTIIDGMVNDFNKSHPGIKVVNDRVSADYPKLMNQVVTELQTEDFPDLVECYPDHVERYFDFGKVQKLDDLIADPDIGFSSSDLADFEKVFLDEGKQYSMEGTFSLPLSKSTDAVYYNATALIGKTIGDANGGEPITHEYLNSLTWDELFDVLAPACKAYNESAEHKDELYDTSVENSGVFYWDSDENLFVILAEQYGYGYTSVDTQTGAGELLWNNDNMKGLMKKLRSAKENGYFGTHGSLNDYPNTVFTKRGCLFSVGSTAGYSYQAKEINFDIGVCNVPQAPSSVEGHKKADLNQGPSVCILRHANQTQERVRAAFEFYKYMTETTNNSTWATGTGYMPVRDSAKRTNAFIRYVDETRYTDHTTQAYCGCLAMKFALESLEEGFLFSNVTFKGSATSRLQVGGLITKILTNETTPTDAQIDEWFNAAETATRQDMNA